MNNNDQVQLNIVLNDGRIAPKEFYDNIKDLIVEITPILTLDATYTAERLCGPEYWSTLEKGGPELTGRCIKHMVDHGLLPLKLAGCKHQFPRRYKLK
jgi:hypothetical protein